MSLMPIDLATGRRLIDFSGGDDSLKHLAEVQIQGAVALHNMIADPEVGMGYLADEVGMGKTYIALGVVAIMRYFNPMMRVLYLCPSRNVQEKWVKEYKGFIRHNVRVSQGRIRTRDGKPAAPYQSCRNIMELLHVSASGYYADVFIGKDSFSMPLSDDVKIWQAKRDELKRILPAHEWSGVIRSKQSVKEQYARALNYILPHFDLVVIDEAHNFKRDFESSDRNMVLSRVLGFREEDDYYPRVKNALLLSATPYDRDLTQLRNQLNLVGKSNLLPVELKDESREQIQQTLRKYMVRRLNTLNINQQEHTRNMYRREWRSGEKAEIQLETDEQKLVTALVQKKVGDMLNEKSESASFQMGLLASFESFAETTRSPPVEFDGEQNEKTQSDAADRHVIGRLVDSYKRKGLGRTLPHPKMDVMAKRLSSLLWDRGRKQIVFVRRVKSVKELKDKLDDHYSEWLHAYINQQLVDFSEPCRLMQEIYDIYMEESRSKEGDVSGGESDVDPEQEDANLPPKKDTLYAWFFRGEVDEKSASLLELSGYPTPEAVRNSLVVKNQVTSLLLEPNWARYIGKQEDLDLAFIIEQHGEAIAKRANHYVTGDIVNDYQDLYMACQMGFLDWYIQTDGAEFLRPLFEHFSPKWRQEPSTDITSSKLADFLLIPTLFDQMDDLGVAGELFPYQFLAYEAMKEGQGEKSLLQQCAIHGHLISFLVRTGHGMIDLYLSRLRQGAGNLTAESRKEWMGNFLTYVMDQRQQSRFSTWQELHDLAVNLELIIKNNIPEIMELTQDEYRRFLSRALSPVSPIIGATGETKGRSAQARKFRMPGYPLALISTDVFQEGEDLHTFCDSVVHYGLSGSPVGIEQKTGRVDRVSSLAQRRLQGIGKQPEEGDYIQVSFPFVKESIEALQVRHLCTNINAFIESLHHVGGSGQSIQDIIDMHEALNDRAGIPPQIMALLKSPYDPDLDESQGSDFTNKIDQNHADSEKKIRHVSALIDKKLQERQGGNSPKHEANLYFQVNDTQIKLTTAKSSGETLISLTRPGLPAQVVLNDTAELLELMDEISWKTFHRTYAIQKEGAKNGYDIFFNAEMLVGGEDLTQDKEIDKVFERMEVRHDPASYSTRLGKEITKLLGQIRPDTTVFIDRSGCTQINVERSNQRIELVFEFRASRPFRKQRVALYECDGRCVFMSRATPKGYARELTPKKLMEYTWLRNRNIDLVEFVVDPTYAIAARVVHPLDDLQWEEFIYCAYTLAFETDRLEYLLDKHDLH